MRNRVLNNTRKWISLIAAVAIYYLLHEGAHLMLALAYGAFEEIRFLGLGMQIAIDDSALNKMQLALFCLVGSVSALIGGYIMVAFTDRIVGTGRKYLNSPTIGWGVFASTARLLSATTRSPYPRPGRADRLF